VTVSNEGSQADVLLDRIKSKDAVVGVVGLGYVGLPLCVAFSEVGCKVLGFDVDPGKPEAIAAGKSYIRHLESDRIARLHKDGLLDATSDLGRLGEPDVVVICVPTPLTRYLEPDLSYVTGTVESIARTLRPGQLVVLESTTFPGTTQEVVLPILEATGLKSGKDFWLAFSPEREDPGNPHYSTSTIPKVVGADDEDGRKLAAALYQTFASQVVEVSSSSAAEAVKITENIFRSVNIALVNELKLIYGKMGINIWEIVDAAKTKPFGYMPFYPGPGLGGHCIPIDPFYLTWKAKEFNIATRFIELAGQINSVMPEHVVSEVGRVLDSRFQRAVNGARVLVLGLAYKKNIEDMRESPSLRLIELLEERKAKVEYYDPFLPVIPMTREHAELAGRKSIPWDLKDIASYDAVLIATDHDDVDYVGLAQTAKLIVDTRNACARAGADMSRVVLA
jgi:UDP-N-acetyl-D-glucosamine dehydrogenase